MLVTSHHRMFSHVSINNSTHLKKRNLHDSSVLPSNSTKERSPYNVSHPT